MVIFLLKYLFNDCHTWQQLVTPDNKLLQLATAGHTWQQLIIPGNSWSHLATFNKITMDIWLLMLIVWWLTVWESRLIDLLASPQVKIKEQCVLTKTPTCRRCKRTSSPKVFHFSSHFHSLFQGKTLEMDATRRNLEMMHWSTSPSGLIY